VTISVVNSITFFPITYRRKGDTIYVWILTC